MPPPDEFPLLVQARFELVEVHRSIQTSMDIVLARPLQLDRRAVGAVGLRDRYGFHDVVRSDVGAPAEAAARVQCMDADLLRIQSGRLGGIALVDGLKLIACPNLAATASQDRKST